jgi:diguanylate cyclase (GGDEF)-like protein
VAGAFNDLVVQLHESRAALADLARHDCLTGLLNRRALDEMLVDALGRHERVHEGVAVIVIDVDFFRRINEMYGHFAGDEVLRLVSARLSESIREIDRVFRFGGEEFAVLLFNAGRESAEAAAERIRLAVAARPMRVNEIDIDVTISAGIATTDDSANAEGLLNAADAALYCAKFTGRNRVVWVGAMA